MRLWRRYRAWLALASSLIAAVWVYSYRVPQTVRYIDPAGHRFHPDLHLSVQPWWGTPTAVLLVLIGLGLFVRLLPARNRLLRICLPSQGRS